MSFWSAILTLLGPGFFEPFQDRLTLLGPGFFEPFQDRGWKGIIFYIHLLDDGRIMSCVIT